MKERCLKIMNDFLLKKIKDVVVPATGCTEPVAIALNAATARDNLKGKKYEQGYNKTRCGKAF